MQRKQLFTRDLTILVVGQVISLFGNAVLRFALPLYLLRQTDSAALFGAVTACAFLPMVLLSFLGGGIADRVNKRDMMVVLDFVTAGLTAVLCLTMGHLPVVPLLVTGLMLLYGISGAYQPAVQASLPLLVPQEGLVRANAVVNMVSTLAGLLGPVLGGILFGTFGVVPLLLVSALCFLASAVMECFMRIPHVPRQRPAGLLTTVGRDLKESWQYMGREKPVFLRVTGVLALFNFVLSAALIVGIPVMVVQLLAGSDAQLGAAQGALGLGGLAGGLVAGGAGDRLKPRHGSGLLLVSAAAVLVMGAALLPGVSQRAGFLLLTAMSFAAMAAATVFTVVLLAAVQSQTPPQLLGKVMATMLAAANCAQPLGQALYGLLFGGLADRAWVILFGAGLLSGGIALAARPLFRKMEEGGDALPVTAP